MKKFSKRFAIASLLAIAASLPGKAAVILASCTEDVSCVIQGTVSVVTTAGTFDSGTARFAFSILGASTTFPVSNRLETKTFSAASSDFWSSFQYSVSISGTTANAQFVGWFDGATVRLGLEGTGTAQEIRLFKRNAAGTKTTLATATGSTCALNTRCKLDVHIVYGVSGSVDVYNNGVLILTYSGDVTTDGATTLDKVYVSGIQITASTSMRISELLASDSDTRSMRSYSCAPNAAGNTQSWTGSASNVNPNTANDANFNYTTSSNAISQWTPNATTCTIPTSGTTTIIDVRSSGRLARGTTGPQNARFSLHVGASDYDNGSDLSGLTTSFQNFEYDWGANSPATGVPWTPAEINSGFSFGVVSKP